MNATLFAGSDVATAPVSSLLVGPVDNTEARQFVIEHHYSRGIHNGPMCYGLYHDFELVGVCAFATPCSENVRRSFWGPEHVDAVTELHRLVLLDEVPKNAESYFIVRALRALKADRPHICGVVSFADESQGHVGTIYQATNAIYTGASSPATFYLDSDGRLRHPRQNGRNITPALAAERGWTPVRRAAKHRYVFLLPDNRTHLKALRRDLRLSPKPYPKRQLVEAVAA